jgi:hypothetical protein
MFNIPTNDLDQRSPGVNMNENLNFNHMTGMAATQFNNQ